MDSTVTAAANATARATGELLDKGLLGVFCLFLIVVVVHLYRALRSEGKERTEEARATAKAHADELKVLNEQHAEEVAGLRNQHAEEMRGTVKEYSDQMRIFFERHATKAETWVAQGADMTAKFNQAFDKFSAATEALARRSNKQQSQT